MRITIEFCVVWNYTPRAASMAEALVNTFKPLVGQSHPIEQITLIPSGNGRYEVTVDGELIYSKAATGVHTTNEFVVDNVRGRLRQRTPKDT